MNIVKAFTKLIQNHELKIKHGEREFVIIDGELYGNYFNRPYRHFNVGEDIFSCEEILSTEWEIIKKEGEQELEEEEEESLHCSGCGKEYCD